jgi:serine/threonine protein kinase
MIVSEEGCFAKTFERRYYRKGDIFVKRSLRQSEYRTGYRGLHIPKLGTKRLRKEAASLKLIQKSTNIPVPQLYDHFEHDGAYYIAMKYVEGVTMSNLSEDQKEVVAKDLEIYLSTMHTLTAKKIGGPSNLIILPTVSWRRQKIPYGIHHHITTKRMFSATWTSPSIMSSWIQKY